MDAFAGLTRITRRIPHPLPAGCVVLADDDGEWLVFAPELVESMRHDCPICRGEA